MKRIITVIICLFILLTSCSKQHTAPQNDEMLDKLSELYPDAKVEKNESEYDVVSENVSLQSAKANKLEDMANAPVFFSIEEITKEINLEYNIIIIGKKTGESKQCVKYDEYGNPNKFFTESKVQVLETLYGNIEIGDEIVYYEHYAVINEENGNKSATMYYEPINNEEYLFILDGGISKAHLYDNVLYSKLSINLLPIKLSAYKERFDNTGFIGGEQMTLDDKLYEKYIVKKDVALNEEYELQKLQEWKESIEKANAIIEKREPKEAILSDQDKETVKSFVKKYNELSDKR